MIQVDVPGYGKLELLHVVLDYNGTMACDGLLLEGVREEFDLLRQSLEIHVLTADTFGKVAQQLEGIPCNLSILPPGDQAEGKLAYVEKLGTEHCACVGNGRNDRLMLAKAALGIAVILEEGAAMETVSAADVVCGSIVDALRLLRAPLRLTATLRS